MPPPKKIDEKTVVQRYVDGDCGTVQLAEQYGVCHKTIKKILSKHGVSVKTGETIIPKNKREEARRMYESGVPIKRIAKDIGVWGEKLKKIAKLEEWSDLNQQKKFDPDPRKTQYIIDLYRQGEKIQRIASDLGQNTNAIRHLLRKCGVQIIKAKAITRKYTEEQYHKAIELYASGMGQAAVAKALNVSDHIVSNWIKKSRVKKHPLKRVSQSIKDEIMRLYLDELMTPREIGPRVGMTEEAVNTHVTRSGKRRSISEAQALAANKRAYKKGKGGYWQSAKTGKWVYAMSIMEMLRMQQHDSNPEVENWDRFVPSVEWAEGRYVPDIYVEYADGRKVVEEVKPSSQHKYEENQKKWDAARKHFGAIGIEFMVVDENMVGGEMAIRSFNYEGLQEINNEERTQRKKEVHDAYRQRNKQRIKSQSRKRYDKYKSDPDVYGKMLEASRRRKSQIRAATRSNSNQLVLPI